MAGSVRGWHVVGVDDGPKDAVEHRLTGLLGLDAQSEFHHLVGEQRAEPVDGGWLLTFVHDAATDGSAFVVLDAGDVAAGPVATVALLQRVPAGFHGNWVATV